MSWTDPSQIQWSELSPLARSLYDLCVESLFDPANKQMTMRELREWVRVAWQRRHAEAIAEREEIAYREATVELIQWLNRLDPVPPPVIDTGL